MSDRPQHEREQVGHSQPGAENDPDATLLAPWSKRYRRLEIASQPTIVQTPGEAKTEEAFLPTVVQPEPVTEASLTEAEASTFVRANQIDEENVPTYQKSTEHISSPARAGISRRKVLIGGAVATVALTGGAAVLAKTFFEQQKPVASRPAIRPVHLTNAQSVMSLRGHIDIVVDLIWSADRKYLASSARSDPFLMVWDLASRLGGTRSSNKLDIVDEPAHKLELYTYGSSGDELYWMPDGRHLLTKVVKNISDEYPALVDPFEGSQPLLFTNGGVKKGLGFSLPIVNPQGTLIAAVDRVFRRSHKIDVWQVNAPTRPFASLIYQDAQQYVGDASRLNNIGWSCDGTYIAALTINDEVVIWDVAQRRVHASVKLPLRVKETEIARMLRINLSWSPVDPHLLAVSNVDTITVISAERKQVHAELFVRDKQALSSTRDPNQPDIHYPNIVSFAWSPDGRYIAGSYARSSKIFLWDMQAKKPDIERGLKLADLSYSGMSSDNHTIYSLSWSPDGRYMATSSSRDITIWLIDNS